MKNKNSLIKILSLVLSACFVFSVAGCNSSNSKNPETPAVSYRGTHVHDNVDSGKYLIKDGTCDYRILISSDSSDTIDTAVTELTLFFEQATGIKLDTVTEATSSGKYLSIGKTDLFKSSGLIAEAELGSAGYKITTKGDDVFMYGYKDEGSLNAVYGLLEDLFGFDAYYWDTVGLEKGVTEKKLMNYNVKEIPDFAVRATGYEVQTVNSAWERRLGVIEMWKLFENVALDPKRVGKVHNSLHVLDQSYYNDPTVTGTYQLKNFGDDTEYALYNPEWYYKPKTDDKANQLCFTAHGDEQSWELMMKTAADQMIEVIKKSEKPKEEILRMQFDVSDNSEKCTCDACKAAAAEYGNYSALNIKACNKLSDLIKSWMQTEEGRNYEREFQIYFLAYESMQYAPVVEIDGVKTATIRCNDNVLPIVAPSYMDFMQSIYAEDNINDKNDMELWKLVSDELFLWSYSTNFYHYLIMYDTFGQMQEYYQFCYDNGYRQIREQSQSGQYGGSSGFQNLKVYLQAKLYWNVDADYNQLIQNYFDTYFGPASDIMLKLFNENRVYIAGLKEREGKKYGGVRSMYLDADNPEFWNTSVLKHWWQLTEDAMDAIESVKTVDSSLYQTLYDHIAMERISYLYMLVSIFEYDLSEQELTLMKDTLLEDFLRLGITQVAQYKTVADITKNW